MCGIVYKHNFKKRNPVNNDIMQQFDKQRSRGVQGFGLFDGQFKNIVKSATEDKILEWLVKHDSNLIMFHHRFPTSTINVKRAAHPMATKFYFGNTQYVMIHNGVIRNADKLFEKHAELGIEYQTLLDDHTFNDSESLLWDFALTMEGKQEKMQAEGQIAFVCIKMVNGKLSKLLFGRNSRPLNMLREDDSLSISSEGAGVPIPPNMLHIWDYRTKTIKLKAMHFDEWGYHPTKVPKYTGGTCGYQPKEYVLPENRSEGTPGDWLPEYLQHKYGKYLPSGSSSSASELAPPIDYVESGKSGLWVPQNRLEAEESMEIEEVDENDRTRFLPTPAEIQAAAMEYLIDNAGHFEGAYWAAELDYGELMVEEQTVANIRQQLLLEKVLEHINSDPEYESGHKVSSIWEALWSQNSLALAA